ncbi:MAG: carbohydrate ABC transporter permease [Gemmatimonadota bacterium]
MITRRDQWTAYAVLGLFSAIALYPVLGILGLALHTKDDQITGFALPTSFSLETFQKAWVQGEFATGLWSSLIVAVAVTAVSVVVSIGTGYAFGTMRFRGDGLLFGLILLGLIFPYEATVIPLYYDLEMLGLTNTYWALILPQIGLSIPFGTFWMRAFFRSAPRSLIEAARVDGASSLTILVRVLLPQAKPALLTLSALIFMYTWNEFLLALVMIQDPDKTTAPLGLSFFATATRAGDPTAVAAAAVIVALPVIAVYVILQRHFIRGITAGSVKE